LPLRRHALTRPLPGAEAPFGRSMPPDRSRSALVVSHHLDGFLQRQGRELVASRYRQGFTSVGGPPADKPAGFTPTAAHTPQNRALQQWSAPSEAGLSPGVASRAAKSGLSIPATKPSPLVAWMRAIPTRVFQPPKGPSHPRQSCTCPDSLDASTSRFPPAPGTLAPFARIPLPTSTSVVHSATWWLRPMTPTGASLCRFPTRSRSARGLLVHRRLHDRGPLPGCRVRQPGGCVP
jgi:hypothetical protein